ncbi:TIM barrel protein [Infirmifilum sp. NZ]|uniref:TIM barrel protein n=1 Tax=Infirmifilum sp. NZ TaxID=2926850 RepID=UPI00279FF374|nr:TIM barrel protein [Infirmifilum sp. NZ]UNQ72915.1 TIM barrel protein [Infirmifilum sp. NZ]
MVSTALWRPQGVYFGPAGVPTTVKKGGVVEGILEVKRLGLDAMEIEFVRKIFLDAEGAREVKSVASQLGIVLTVHAPYYINLNSSEGDKVKASVERILESARVGYSAGAWSVCFHAGYYGSEDPRKVHSTIKSRVREIVRTLENEGIEIWIRPETTGKPSQYGALEEILELSSEIDMVLPVVDFAHLHARGAGALKRYDDFARVLSLIEEKVGRYGLDNMHIHVSGIEYSEKGEIRHLNLAEADLDYQLLVKALREFDIKGVVISESPNLEGDAMLLKELFYGPSRRRRSKTRASRSE